MCRSKEFSKTKLYILNILLVIGISGLSGLDFLPIISFTLATVLSITLESTSHIYVTSVFCFRIFLGQRKTSAVVSAEGLHQCRILGWIALASTFISPEPSLSLRYQQSLNWRRQQKFYFVHRP